uniref:RNase H type-1 domain-containing protein n=1 Tax=Nicotiana tabacum TaxID=4097 RepID=A0A1S3X7M4_TOBAC|nr:PREDICTED: uncharacterized protein LOC107762006 [Nicotiana tabacum]
MGRELGRYLSTGVITHSKIDYVVVKWHKPPEYWLKINTDGIKDAKGNSGIGGIYIDHKGKLTMTFASSIGRTNSNMAEASAALAGVEWCSRNGCNNTILECDSQLVVDLINSWILQIGLHPDCVTKA